MGARRRGEEVGVRSGGEKEGPRSSRELRGRGSGRRRTRRSEEEVGAPIDVPCLKLRELRSEHAPFSKLQQAGCGLESRSTRKLQDLHGIDGERDYQLLGHGCGAFALVEVNVGERPDDRIALEDLSQLLHRQLAGAVLIPRVEDVADRVARDVQSKAAQPRLKLLATHTAVAIDVPRPKQTARTMGRSRDSLRGC